MADTLDAQQTPGEGSRQGPSLAKLKRLANAQKFDELETVWLDALAASEIPTAELVPVCGQVGRLGETGRAEALLEFLLSTVEEREGPAAALATARLAAEELPESAPLRGELARLYGAVHADFAALPELLRPVFAPAVPLAEATATVEAILRLRPGAFVRDPRHLEPGVVESIDGHGALVASYAGRHEEYPLAKLRQITVLPADHFPAMLLYRADELREIARERPVAFVRMALAATGDHTLAYKDLKTQVSGLLGEKGWTAWWGAARLALKQDPRIVTSGASQPTFRLLAADRAYEDRLREQFDAVTDPAERLRFVLDALGEVKPESEGAAALLRHFAAAAGKLASELTAKEPALALAAVVVQADVAEMGKELPKPSPEAIAAALGKVADPTLLPRRLDERLLRTTLDQLRAALPERWAEVWAGVLPRTGRRLAETLAREMLEAGHAAELESALAEVVARPTTSPDVLCWLWRARRTGKQAPVLAGMAALPERAVLDAMLNLADATGRLCAVSDEERHHKTLALVQQTIGGTGGMPIREVAAALDTTGAHRLKEQIETNGGLTPSLRHELLAHVRASHPDVFHATAKPWEEDVIYTTAAGLDRRRSEFEDLVKVQLPLVAKQIGEAAAHGDLSENAEYKAALEKRDLVTGRASEIEAELARARLITAEMAGSSFVNVGTRVRARELGGAAGGSHGAGSASGGTPGEETVFRFLGPWDTDPDRHILSYDAPLALAFMGKKPGEIAEYGEGPDRRRWEVLEVGAGV